MAVMKLQTNHDDLESTHKVDLEVPLRDQNQVDDETKKIVHKVDKRLLPVLTFLYLICFLDRGNIGNANVAGMSDELNLTGTQYNIALTVFFFPYSVFEVPSNMVLKVVRPSIWISFLLICWGTVMTLQGIVQNYHHLIVTRTLLGLFESGFFPAATYLLTCWHRFEIQTRMSIFYTAASLSGAFSGLLAFALQKMDGIGGLSGWRWIFVLEGIVTVLTGLGCYWALPDSPQTASFLSCNERDIITQRLEQDTGTSSGRVGTNENFEWVYLTSALSEWKIYLAVVIFWSNTICVYGFTYSAPTIIHELGYTASEAQLLTVPIYFLCVCSTILFSRLSDKSQSRWLWIVVPYFIALVGLIGLLSIPHPRLPGLTYAFLFCIPAGVYPPLIGAVSWIGNNLAPSWKRVIGMALFMSIGNLGGAVGSNIFLTSQKPHYWLGYGMCMFIVVAAIISTLILRYAYASANAERDELDPSEIEGRYSDEELLKLGDRSPYFRYVV
ncbi:Sucrose/H+ symporter, plant [Penicillium camemberti]|uniref:Sucrose/H+ symporter, plant n=1 Tax=Penicillium camemberti (strain FM 013) TaxID=1429867 RepID=A0A0G4NX06_PENC3|nr:Sucrose/H+ symporter, plant [Penicillium camemberti]